MNWRHYLLLLPVWFIMAAAAYAVFSVLPPPIQKPPGRYTGTHHKYVEACLAGVVYYDTLDSNAFPALKPDGLPFTCEE